MAARTFVETQQAVIPRVTLLRMMLTRTIRAMIMMRSTARSQGELYKMLDMLNRREFYTFMTVNVLLL